MSEIRASTSLPATLGTEKGRHWGWAGGFIVIWFGHLVSVIGSGLSGFVLSVWVYQKTGSVTDFALIALCRLLPEILCAPLAGTLIDRWNRRWVMFAGVAGASLGTLIITLLAITGQLALWQIYLFMVIGSICNAFHGPAYSAATTLLVEKQHLGRANGMVQFGEAASQIFSPLLAGILLMILPLEGVLLIDLVTYLFALGALLIVDVPQLKGVAGPKTKNALLREMREGWKCILKSPGLLGLISLLVIINFILGAVYTLSLPLVLSLASAATLGTVMSIVACGMLVGSIVLSIWGGPARRINGALGFLLLCGLCIAAAGSRPSIPLLTACGFVGFFCLSISNGSILAIFQSKVAPDMQGRVFSISRMMMALSLPCAYLTAGRLADTVFEPLLAAGGPLAGTVGLVIGVGPGRGIGLLFIIMGTLTMLATAAAYLFPPLRHVENELLDATTDDHSSIEQCDIRFPLRKSLSETLLEPNAR